MKRINSILYMAEPSVEQGSAIERAVSLAENNQADLTVIDIAPAVAAGIRMPPSGPSSTDLQSAMVAERLEGLEHLIAPYKERHNITLDVLTGKPFIEAIRAVLRDKHDLLIKPAENPNWMERLLGSDDMHLLRKCPCPVWMIKPAEKANYDCIIAAVDFDPYQQESLTRGLNRDILELASSLAIADFAALHLVHAWEAPAEGLLRSWSDNPDDASRNYIEGERSRHQHGMERVLGDLQELIGAQACKHLSPRGHTTQGPAAKVVPELAVQLQADLVVMGTLGRSGIAGYFIGNTAESILDQLQCSVLAVKPPDFVTPVKLDA